LASSHCFLPPSVLPENLSDLSGVVFLQAGCPPYHVSPNNSVIALKESLIEVQRDMCKQGCSGAGTRGNVPYIFLCGNGIPIDIFVLVGTAFPLPEFVL